MPAADPEPPSAVRAGPALELLLDVDADAADGAAGDGDGPRWLPDRAFLLDWARHALAATFDDDAPPARVELSVRLVGARTMRSLNRDWRDRDAPTNVLSFPSGLPALAGVDGEDGLLALGDIALCPAVVSEEARAQGKAEAAHWAHLVVHGVLHLRGHDHERDDEARLMEALETRLLSMRDLPDPHADGAPR